MSRKSVLVYAPEPEGGHPDYVNALFSALRSADVTWVVAQDASAIAVAPHVKRAHVLPTMPKRESTQAAKWALFRLLPWKRHDISFILWCLRTRLKGTKFDTCVIEELQRFTLPLLVAATKLLSTRVVVHLHNVRRHDYRGSLFDALDTRMTAAGLRSSDLVVLHEDAMAEELLNITADVRIAVVPHGLTPRVNFPYAPPDEPQLLFFGVNRPNKGLDTLLTSLSGMGTPPPLHIVGYTPENYLDYSRAAISKYASRHALSWLNTYVTDEELAAIIPLMTAMVLPYRDFSAQSGVLNLAVEYCLPVVVTDVGGLGSMVRRHFIGVVARDDSEQGLRDAIREACDPTRNAIFRKNMRRIHDDLRWSTVGVLFEECL